MEFCIVCLSYPDSIYLTKGIINGRRILINFYLQPTPSFPYPLFQRLVLFVEPFLHLLEIPFLELDLGDLRS